MELIHMELIPYSNLVLFKLIRKGENNEHKKSRQKNNSINLYYGINDANSSL